MSSSLDWWCSFVEPDNFQRTMDLHSANKLLLELDLLAPWLIITRSQTSFEHFLYAFEDICNRFWRFLSTNGNAIGCNSISNYTVVSLPTEMLLAGKLDATRYFKVLNSRIIPKVDVTKEKNEMYPQMQMNDYAILS